MHKIILLLSLLITTGSGDFQIPTQQPPALPETEDSTGSGNLTGGEDLQILAQKHQPNTPHLKLLNQTAEVDTISPHRPVTADIRFVNDGDAPLYILRVNGDCGCTSADYPFDAIAPGDTAAITIGFDPRGRSHGPFRKLIRIKSNATNHTTIAYIKGTIRKSLTK